MSTTIEIDSIVIPIEALGEFSQDYEEINAQKINRTADGGGILRRLYGGKVKTIINARGWAPSTFDGIDLSAAVAIKCAMPRSVDGATVAITIPANRRSDSGHIPQGWAVVDGLFVETTVISIVANVATLTAVSGATAYRATYYPEISALVTSYRGRGNTAATFEWSMEAEEV